mmetsp:Transcript_15699/g.36834  ORF Transcript_15699/g.36834 Transcript_15699/m.36834 type:complete len:247 (-) Transcript_15699:7-747(-)
MVTTLAAAVFPDSDPDDDDYEDVDNVAQSPKADSPQADVEDEELLARRQKRAEDLWEEMQLEVEASSARRPPCRKLDPLMKDLQRRHPRPPKNCAWAHVQKEVGKFSCSVVEAPSAVAVAKDLKQKTRTLVVNSEELAAAAATQKAGGAVPFSNTARTPGIGSKGKLAQLQAVLEELRPVKEASIIDKSGAAWSAHKKGKEDLQKLHLHPQAGVLDRKEFLARSNVLEGLRERDAKRRRRNEDIDT